MDAGWMQEIERLFRTDDFKIGLLISAITAVGAAIKMAPWVKSYLGDRAYKQYAASTSFGRDEVKSALSGYVSHEGMSSDPSTRLDLADALAIRREPLFSMLDELVLTKKTSKHVFVFADCGMGKTTFLINYFHRRRNRFRRNKLSMVLVSLSRSGYLDEIRSIPPERHAETVLLMDAFDEDPLVFDGVAKRLETIVNLTSSFRSVVISCRSQFFASDKDIPVTTGAVRVGPTPLGVSKEYEFTRLYIAPFDGKRVRQYLRTAFPGLFRIRKRVRSMDMISRVPSLVMRPMLLAHISDVLEDENQKSLMNVADIYQAIVSAWVKRESRWVNDRSLLDFSKRLALDIFQKRHFRGGEHCSRHELTELAAAWKIPIKEEFLTGRSLLNRTDDGRCKFAHRSIMEYLVATAILEGLASDEIELTAQISSFIFERLGIAPRFPDGLLDQGATLAPTAPENRLGYPTNFNMYYDSPEALDASLLYGVPVQDGVGAVCKLGEHIQYMMEHLAEPGRIRDVRISVAHQTGDVAIAYISVWGSSAAALSRLILRVDDWIAMFGHRWLGRRFLNVVGRRTYRGDSASDLSYYATTLSNFASDVLGVESADDCQVLSAGAEGGERVGLRLIPNFQGAGPLLPFGILRGGSLTHLDGKKTRLLHRRELDSSWNPTIGMPINQESPLMPVAERWPAGKRGY